MARKLATAEASNSGILGVFAGDGGAPEPARTAQHVVRGNDELEMYPFEANEPCWAEPAGDS